MEINEKAAYLKGLFDGYEFDASKKETKIISELLDLVSDMTERIGALESECSELRDYIEELDEDLGSVEELLYDESADGEDEDEFDEDEDDSGYYEVTCPNCGEKVCFDESLELADVVCPACGEKIGDVDICDGDCEKCDNSSCKDEK